MIRYRVLAAIIGALTIDACADTAILYSAENRQLPVGARLSALGDAGAALPLGTHALYYNPASLSFLKKYECWVEGAVLYSGLSRHAVVAGGAPVQQDLAIGLLAAPYFSGGIPVYDTLPGTYADRLSDPTMRSNGEAQGVFTNDQYVSLLSIARKFTFDLPRPSGIGGLPLPLDIGLGCNISVLAQTMDPGGTLRMGMNINCDVGAIVRIGVDYDMARKEVSRQFCLGAGMLNVLPTAYMWLHSPYQYEEPVYNAQYYGISYADETGFLHADWLAALDLHRAKAETAGANAEWVETLHAGLEARFWKMVSIRCGISDRTPTLGAGLEWHDFFLDYAFRLDAIDFSPVRIAVGGSF